MGLQAHNSLVPRENRSQDGQWGRAKQVDVPERDHCKMIGKEGWPLSSMRVIPLILHPTATILLFIPLCRGSGAVQLSFMCRPSCKAEKPSAPPPAKQPRSHG